MAGGERQGLGGEKGGRETDASWVPDLCGHYVNSAALSNSILAMPRIVPTPVNWKREETEAGRN